MYIAHRWPYRAVSWFLTNWISSLNLLCLVLMCMGSTCSRYPDFLYSPLAITVQFRLDFVYGQESMVSRKCWCRLSNWPRTICEWEGSNAVIVGIVIYMKAHNVYRPYIHVPLWFPCFCVLNVLHIEYILWINSCIYILLVICRAAEELQELMPNAHSSCSSPYFYTCTEGSATTVKVPVDFLLVQSFIEHHKITQLMSCVDVPKSRFENKDFACMNPNASYWNEVKTSEHISSIE